MKKKGRTAEKRRAVNEAEPAADETDVSARHFSARRRTAVVLAGEGTGLAYLSGVVKALAQSGVRMDLVLGRGAGAVVAGFAAVGGNHRLYEEDGLVARMAARRPYRLRRFHRVALACLALAFAFFLAPAFLGAIAIVALPVRALLAWLIPGDGTTSDLLATLYRGLESYYLPAIAVPVIVVFLVSSVRWGLVAFSERRLISPLREESLFFPVLDLSPLAEALESQLWKVVRGASTQARPPSRPALGEAYRELLEASLGQHPFSELVLYALDSDAGREVPFVVLKERFKKKLSSRRDGADAAEPVDLCGEGAPVLLDALVGSVSPPVLVPGVPIKLPLGNRFGGEVHRFSSSVLLGRDGLADAVACGAEQILYVTSASSAEAISGSPGERLCVSALRRSLDDDLVWAAASADLPIFVIRPDVERLRPYELQGRQQFGGERLMPLALVAQGERDAIHQFIHPVLGEDMPTFASAQSTLPIPRGEWEKGPNEL